MARCLNLTKAAEYAVSALSRLAVWSGEEEAGLVPIGRLARDQKLPAPFLAKLFSRCAKAGLVRSGKGRAGGVALARPAERITVLDLGGGTFDVTLLEIIEVFQGPYWRDLCVFFPLRPCEGPSCEVFCPLRQEEQSLREGLAGVTLADMAAALARHPEAKTF